MGGTGGTDRRSPGRLTPLLGVFVMLDITGFWSIAWQARDVVPPTYAALVVGLAITGLYYIAEGAGAQRNSQRLTGFGVFPVFLACGPRSRSRPAKTWIDCERGGKDPL